MGARPQIGIRLTWGDLLRRDVAIFCGSEVLYGWWGADVADAGGGRRTRGVDSFLGSMRVNRFGPDILARRFQIQLARCRLRRLTR